MLPFGAQVAAKILKWYLVFTDYSINCKLRHIPGKMLVVGSLGIFLLLLHLFEER